MEKRTQSLEYILLYVYLISLFFRVFEPASGAGDRAAGAWYQKARCLSAESVCYAH